MAALVRVPSSPIAACGAILVAISIGALAARHRRVRPPAPAIAIEAPVAREDPGPLDLNAADAQTLERLPRIGPALARRIVEDREARGPFRAVDDLDRVRGIGPATVSALRPLVTVPAPDAGAPSLARPPGSE